ncbi:MAG: Major Facilitator Superfamily protein [Methanocella sp. PtaU1.Bin125]|nr:MAG: Major Facilitator Superfamily protein [Methanocella sp. PtaU1.Bin125]
MNSNDGTVTRSLRNQLTTGVVNYKTKLKSFSPNARLYLLFVFLTTLNAGIYGVLFNLYILRLGFGEDFLGLILALTSVTVGLFAIPSALICDRLGRRNTLLLSSAVLLCSLAFLYTTTSESMLVLFSILYGVSSSLYMVVGATFMVENSSPYERMHLFAVYSVIYTVAVLCGNMIGGFLPDALGHVLPGSAETMTFRLTLYASLAAVAFAFVPLLFIRERRARPDGFAGQLKVFGSVFRSRAIRNMLLVYCVYGAGWGMALPYFNVYFSEVLGAGTGQIGTIFTLSQVVMMLGYFAVPIVTERLGKVRTASLVQAFSIPFLLLFVATSSVIVATVGFVMRYLLMNMANPILNSFKLEIATKEQHAVVNSLTWMACYTFVGLGTYAGGLLMAGGYNTMPFLLTCALYGVSAVLYYVLFNDIERRQTIRTAAQA